MSARAYPAHLATTARAAMTYRVAALAGVLTQLGFGGLRCAVLIAAYHAGIPGAGRTTLALGPALDYVWLGQAFLRIQPMRPDADLIAAMRAGTLAVDLTRPVDPFAWWWSRAIGACLGPTVVRCVPLLAIALAAGWLHPPQSLLAAAAFLLLLGLAALLSAAMSVDVALLADWSTGASPWSALLLSLVWLGGGILLPLPLFPPAVQGLIALLPFRALLDSPVRAWSGDLTGGALGWAVVHSVVWILLLVGLGQLLTRRGLARLALQGG